MNTNPLDGVVVASHQYNARVTAQLKLAVGFDRVGPRVFEALKPLSQITAAGEEWICRSHSITSELVRVKIKDGRRYSKRRRRLFYAVINVERYPWHKVPA